MKDNEPGLSWVGTSAGLGSFYFSWSRAKTGGAGVRFHLYSCISTLQLFFQLFRKHLFDSVLCLDFWGGGIGGAVGGGTDHELEGRKS